VSREGSLGCGACGVPLKHRPGSPARQAHEIAFTSSAAEPLMRESVPKLMTMEIGNACLHPAPVEHLGDCVIGETPFPAEPEPRQVRCGQAITAAKVSIQRANGAATDCEHPLTSTLSHHPKNALIEVHVLGVRVVWRPPESRYFGAARPCVQEDVEDGKVSAVLKTIPAARVEKPSELFSAQHRR